MSEYSNNLWVNQVGYGASAPKLDYLTDEQNCLAERIRIGRMLYKSRHRCCYLDERRTQWKFRDMEVMGRVMKPYAILNLLRRFTNTLTDLLLGEAPIMRSDENAEALAAIADRTDLGGVIYDAAREASWASQGAVEVIRWDNQAYVQNVPPGQLFPLGMRNPDGQFGQYRRFATAKVADQNYLLETTYSDGQISRELYTLDGSAKKDKVNLSLWPVKRNGADLPEMESTGIDWNSIVWMPNQLEEGEPISDYDDSSLIELQDELNAKNTQIAVVLAKHADPKLGLPQSLKDSIAGGAHLSQNDLFWFRTKDEIPTYITWNAELAAAVEDRNFVMDGMCMASEVGQVLLGLKKGAAPDAARKLRLEATPTLARIKRKARYVIPFIKQVIDTAVAMENTAKVVKVSMSASVELRDGLPTDELDEAQVVSLKTGGQQVMSVERAVGLDIRDPEEAAAEVARIKSEAAAKAALATPNILLGGEQNQQDTGGAPVPQQQQKEAA